MYGVKNGEATETPIWKVNRKTSSRPWPPVRTCRLMTAGGFLLNNELTDFNFTPSLNPITGQPATNDVAPGKRPRSSMVPTMIFNADGEPIIAYGSPGGSTIINSVFNVTLNLLDHGMTIQDAIDAPRISVTAAGGSIARDNGAPGSKFTGFSPAAVAGLTQPVVDVGARLIVAPVLAPGYPAYPFM